MSLEELNKKIYEKDSSVSNARHEESKFDPWSNIKNNPNIFKEKEEKRWEKTEDKLKADKKKAIKWGALILGGIAFILLSGFAYIKIKQSAFTEEKVRVAIEGIDNVESGQSVKYKIIISNENRIDLKNAKLALNYSENFSPNEKSGLKIENQSNSNIEIGKIKSKSKSEYEIEGSFLAPQDFVVYLHATILYSPSSSNSTYQSKSQLGVNIKNSPIVIDFYAPQTLSSGDQAEYVVNYKNNSSKTFDDIRIQIDYPSEFSFVSSDPGTSEKNNLWYVGSLGPQKEGKIISRGIMQGSGGEVKIAKAAAGSRGSSGQLIIYNQKQATTKITSSALVIAQEINTEDTNVDAGEVLEYKINFKNQGEIGLRNAVVTFEVQSEVLDFSKLQVGNKGSFDINSKTITWKASDVPVLKNLEPGKGGELRFSIPVYSNIPVNNKDDKNFKIVTVAKIDSPDVPTPVGRNKTISSNTLELKLNSKIVLTALGFYNDSSISNTGPIPPKVGEETTYTIHWKIINVSNEISDAKVSSSLPSGVKWKNKISPDNEKIEYNERTNEIVWQLGKLENGMGVFNLAREVSFQISITPQPNQINQAVKLLNPATFTANDLFTKKELKFQVQEKNTELYEDGGLNGNYRVVE
jgi:hypothetical protein